MRNMRAHQSTLDPFLKYEQNVSTPVKSQLPISTVNISLSLYLIMEMKSLIRFSRLLYGEKHTNYLGHKSLGLDND